MSNKDWCVAGAVVRTLEGYLIEIHRVTDDNGVYSTSGGNYCRTELTPLDNGLHGYRWGVEYATKGAKPDLADDVVVCVDDLEDAVCVVSNWRWHIVESFCIVDERYKPADTSYLDKSPEQNTKVLAYHPADGWVVVEVIKQRVNDSGIEVFACMKEDFKIFWSADIKNPNGSSEQMNVPVEVDMIAQAKYEFSRMSTSFQDLMQESFDKVIAKMEKECVVKAAYNAVAKEAGIGVDAAISELYDLGYLVIPSCNN